MDHRTFFEVTSATLAAETETRQAETLRAYRVRQSRENLNAAIGRVVGDRELSKGEQALVDGIRAEFTKIAIQDPDADAESVRQANAMVRAIMSRTGADALFGLVEDIVNEKSTAQGDELTARAKRLYDQFHPDAKGSDEDGG